MRLATFLSATLLAAAAFAAAPADRYKLETDTASDSRTGLTWTRTIPVTGYSWISALNYCRTLKVGVGAAAVGGWRLPTIKELQTLVDERGTTVAIDGTAFPNTPALAFWSASPSAADATKAWAVHFQKGQAVTGATTSSYRLRCVK